MLVNLSIFIFFSAFLVFFYKRQHLLVMLLSLKMMVISLYLFLFLYFWLLGFEWFFSMIFLTMSVCEGALGLSILVSMVRVHGNDYIMSFSTLW
uniref:NADH-ubiquinone oxidoreductase chain 4L n=1 Tax=Crioceris duodecimpunctata TaxID=184539 RepID=Q8WB12_CRIDU|nr:NADH dehydrogenase subunit 4L [Crioceris duodecimpunctata]AAL67870.1 NADH dehydrogenase subunit 4L [Crioceris duodecimpunctata]